MLSPETPEISAERRAGKTAGEGGQIKGPWITEI